MLPPTLECDKFSTDENVRRVSTDQRSSRSTPHVRFEGTESKSPVASAISLDVNYRRRSYLKRNDRSNTSLDNRSKSSLGTYLTRPSEKSKTSSSSNESGLSAEFELARRKVRNAVINDDVASVARLSAMSADSLNVDKVLMDSGRRHSFQTDLGILYDKLDAQRLADLPRNKVRRWADWLARSNTFQVAMAFVIIAHICIGAHDTNLRAAEKATPDWVVHGEAIILITYLFEICLRCYVKRLAFFLQAWNIFDCAIVLCDVVMSTTVSYGGVSLLRSFRLLRVLRVVVRFSMFREVYLMIQGVNSAIRTLVFGAMIGFAIMTSWSLLAVDILNPLVKELAEQGIWNDCERCPRAFSSVMAANLTFFKSVVAGDSWGQICVPLMENYTQAAVLLTLVFLTIQLGVVNIIIAVIVDQVHEARVRDESLRQTVKEEALHKSYRRLWRVFKSMDVDETGEISLEQMRNGYSRSSEFRFLMNSIDFTSDNMDLFFDILDKDRSGGVSYDEFVEQLHVLREFDSHSMLIIITHLVEKLYQHIDTRLDDRTNLERTMVHNLVKNAQQTKQLHKLVRDGSFEGDFRGSITRRPTEGNINDLCFTDKSGVSANPDAKLCNDVTENNVHDEVSAYEKLLEHICVLEIQMRETITKFFAEGHDRHDVAVLDDPTQLISRRDSKASKCRFYESLAQEVLERTQAGLLDEGDLKQMKASVQNYLSYAKSQTHDQDHTSFSSFQKEALEGPRLSHSPELLACTVVEGEC